MKHGRHRFLGLRLDALGAAALAVAAGTASVMRRPSPILGAAVAFMLGFQANALSTILADRSICVLCASVSACLLVAVLATGFAHKTWFTLSMGIFAGALLSHFALIAVKVTPVAQITPFEQKGLATTYADAGKQPVFVVFQNPQCHVCQDFKRQDEPRLKREFPGAPQVVYLPAEPGMPTPTIALWDGSARCLYFAGRPPYERLSHGLKSYLPLAAR